MAINKRFRVVVRQRVNWTPGADTSVPETKKPLETEGYSIERDITDYVENYHINRQRGTLAQDVTVDIINPKGVLTPTNPDSTFNRTSLGGVDTYTPILIEGNELQIYRIAEGADISNRANWKPRFRGKIRKVNAATTEGFDTLQLTAGSFLADAVKKSLTGVYSPIMYTTSIIPTNSYYTLPTLVSAVAKFRDVTVTRMLSKLPESIYGAPTEVETAEISDVALSKNLWWDRDDVIYRSGRYLAPPYFNRSAFTYTDANGASTTITPDWEDEPTETAKTPVPVQDSTATAIWTLNGHSWYVESGTVTKDSAQILDNPAGAMKLTNAVLRFETTKLPTGVKSRVALGYRMTDNSTLRIQIIKKVYNRTTYAYSGSTTVLDQTVSGPTSFNASLLGGTVLNPPTGSYYQWYRTMLDVAALDASTFYSDTDDSITIFSVKLTSTGIVWVDSPRWEFLSVDKDSRGQAVTLETNILDMPRGERWTTTDGITYTSPYPQHRSMSKTNNRVILRTWSMPYAAGTMNGFGPNNLNHRCLPDATLYERELMVGSDYEVLYDKGAIQLSSTFRRCEVYVSGTSYDLEGSAHMEASQMLKRLLMEGGIPASKISLEPTGIILSKISLGMDTSTSVLKAIKELLSQIPANYYVYEDGDANVFGRFIQQNGSPRIFNPITQTPVSQISGGVLVPDAEYWYGITALMADGKETLLSNMSSTVPYQDYFDFRHSSIVTSGSVPALKIKPVPNMQGLVVRRAKAYKTAQDSVQHAAPSPAYVFKFSANDTTTYKSDAAVDAANGHAQVTMNNPSSLFTTFSVAQATYTRTTAAADRGKS